MEIEVFFSYSHQDEEFRQELIKHLSILRRQKVIKLWHDRKITAGSEWAGDIDQHLESAQLILLLISADFLASDYCYDLELQRAMERHRAGAARVVPVILRPVDMNGAPFEALQALPKDAQPITSWADRDAAFVDVVQGLRRVIKEFSEVRVQAKQKVYEALLKLGYRQQARLFRRAIGSESVAAFLIHGLPEYGQRWLLNRLVVQHLPGHLNCKTNLVHLGRLVRKSDVKALWRELAGRVGLRGKQVLPEEIAARVHRWWLTQDVIFVFHDANVVPESALHDLIEGFWLPLTSKVAADSSRTSEHKLLMFLVDYEGKAEQWDIPCVEKLDASWRPQIPIRPPRLAEFTDNDLMMWLENEYQDLPTELTHGIDEKVEEILEQTEGGVPELVMREICLQCGIDWYEELNKWLKL